MVLVIGIFIVSCNAALPANAPGKEDTAKFESSQELKKFSSAEEVAQYLKNAAANSADTGFYGGIMARGGMEFAMAEKGAPPPSKKT